MPNGVAIVVTVIAIWLLPQGRPPAADHAFGVTRQPADHGFRLSAGECKRADADCLRRGPKAWKPSEIDILVKAIAEIHRSPNGRDISGRAQRLGAARLERFTTGIAGSTLVPGIGAALRRDRVSKGIDIYDWVFSRLIARDKNSGSPGYLFMAQALLHECFHAIDDLSEQPEFAEMVGSSAGAQWRFAIRSAAEAAALTTFDNELLRMEQAGGSREEPYLNLRLAMALRPVRFPTMQSTRSPAEAFAELGSHLVLDPGAGIVPSSEGC